METKHLLFSIRMYGANIRSLLHIVAEGIILLASLASLFLLVYQFGFSYNETTEQLIQSARITLLLCFFGGITLRYLIEMKDIIQEKMLYLDIGIYFFLFAVLCSKVFFVRQIGESLPYLDFFGMPLFVYLLLAALSVIHLSRQAFSLLQSQIKPSLLFLLSFIFFIIVGTGLLMLPNATTKPLSFIDALFMSTSAVCITGLTTVDVATSFTEVGQIILLILIQVGGIGVMTFTSFFALSFIGNSSFNSKLALKDILSEERANNLFRVIFNILFVTFLIEGIGAYLIYREVSGRLPGGWSSEIYYAIFHAITGFCNAGISTLSDGLNDPLIANNYLLHIWIALLFIIGGIGFPIVFNYLKLLRHQLLNGIRMLLGRQKYYIHTPRIININTYIVMVSTVVLLVGGTLAFYLLEYHNTAAGLSLKEQWIDAFFTSATPRTAGFTTVDIQSLTQGSLTLIVILMIIGAAPTSTGGGLKVTTVCVALLTTYNMLRGKDRVEILKREISQESIRRAFSIFILYFAWLALIIWLLSITEKGAPFFSICFESVSALSTTGLSLNFTPQLSVAGKAIIIITMLIGRMGVMTFFISLSRTYIKKQYTYPEEHILM